MAPTNSGPNDSPASNLSYGSLRTVNSSSSDTYPEAISANPATQQVPTSSGRFSRPPRFSTPPNAMQYQAPYKSGSNSSSASVQQLSPFSPPFSPSPLRQQVLEQPLNSMLSSLTMRSTPQKRPTPVQSPATTSKRPRLTTGGRSGSSNKSMEEATPAQPLPPPSDVHPHIPSWQQSTSVPATPVQIQRQRMDSPAGSDSSTSSTRRAKMPPGSPIWRHMQRVRASRRKESTNSPDQSVRGSPSPSPARTTTSPRALSPVTPSIPDVQVAHHMESTNSPQRSVRGSRSLSSTPTITSPLALSPVTQSDSDEPEPLLPQPQEEARRQPPVYPSKEIHLRQLQDLYNRVPDLSTSSGEHTVDQLLIDHSHALYLHVFVACLTHAFYRPVDPNRAVWILMDRIANPSLWRPEPNIGQPPPTHVLGLLELPEQGLSLLIWGTCELLEDTKVSIELTFYDSAARLHTARALKQHLPTVLDYVRSSIPVGYDIVIQSVLSSLWTQDFLSMSEPQLNMVFCQMISAVAHELPFGSCLGRGPPVNPVWASNITEAQIRTLLAPIAQGRLRLDDLMSEEGFVPECIYLHGDPFEAEAEADGVEDIPGETDLSEANGAQGAPLDDILTRTDAWDNQRAALESMAESNWYIRSSNGIRYQTGTPSNLSAEGTPAPRNSSSPSRNHSGNDDMDQQGLIESIHILLLNSRENVHSARLAYWHQLKESTPGVECITLVTMHLWLSTLLADPTRSILYIDPKLATELVTRYHADPLEMNEAIPELFDRQKLWPRMGSTVNIVVLMHLENLVDPEPWEFSWVLLDMKAEHGRVTTMDVVLPPCTAYKKERFAYLTTGIIGGLNSILPRRSLVTQSSKVQQRTHSLILPQPFTQEVIVLVMLGYLLGKMLGQPVNAVNANAMRQGVCFYYDHAIRVREVDTSFPWQGLTDMNGQLLTENNSEEVRQKRFILSVNQQPLPFEMFPRERSYAATVATPGPSEPFFLELMQTRSDHPAGILVRTTGRSVTELEKATLMGPYPSFPESHEFPDHLLSGHRSLSLDQFVALVHSLGGPESNDVRTLFLSGKYNDRRITIDCLKDATFPLAEWLMAGHDVDSLTLTSYEAPEFLEAGSYHPYPNRALSLTNRNELTVMIDGEEIEMHTCPNFCIMTFGANNQFRLLVFFPRCRNRVHLLWRNIPRESEMKEWYHVFVTALRIVAGQVPHRWQHAAEKTLEALPTTYETAANQTNHGGGERSFVGHRIEPVILNAAFKLVRHLINTTHRLAKYRGYFFHLCGINLKLATMNIHGREDANPLNFAFLIFRFIDWCAQNPHDIIADVGVALNAHRASMPDDLKRSTMLFRYAPLRELLRPGYRKPHQNRYCLSYVVGGAHAQPTSEVASNAGVLKIQAYMKDMLLLYRHRDKSVGANFTVDEALGMGHRDKFSSQMKAFQDILATADTYGVRIEVRLTAWGANRFMQMDPRDLLDRLVKANALVCYPTETLVNFKLTLSKGWSSIIRQQSQLPLAVRRTPEVVVLASVLAYWLKSLVKRPDEMSGTRDMVQRLYLTETAEQHGFPFLRSPALDDDGLRLSLIVEAHRFQIIHFSNVIVPGGNRIKGSRAVPAIAPPPDPMLSPPPSPTGAQRPASLWSQSSDEFLKSLVTVYLPQALWAMFPKSRLRPDVDVNSLRKPLKLGSWSKIVDHMNVTIDITGKFLPSLNKLLPEDWDTGETEGQLYRYDQTFLYRVRSHISTKPVEDQSAYSEELRNRIRALIMQKFDYLPCVQSHKIWPFNSKPGGHREFRIARK